MPSCTPWAIGFWDCAVRRFAICSRKSAMTTEAVTCRTGVAITPEGVDTTGP